MQSNRPDFTTWLRKHHNIYQASRTHMDCAYSKLMQYDMEAQQKEKDNAQQTTK